MAFGPLLARRVRRASAACLGCLATAAVGCGGEVVNLGSSPLESGGSAGTAGSSGSSQGGGVTHTWDLPIELIAPVGKTLLANPTLTSDVQDLYYSMQERGGSPEPNQVFIEHAQRSGTKWGASTELTLGDAMPDASSPAISLDGTELWLGMNTTGSTDIFRSVLQAGAWSAPTPVMELNSVADDVPRQPGFHGNVMPLSSKRAGATPALYQIYLSTRGADGTWSAPSKDFLGSVDSSAFQSADGFLTNDGLELYFSSTRDGDSDLYVAHRATTEANFGEPEALVDLNDPNGSATTSEERMPWLNPTGDQLYFASDRSGQYALYVAAKVP